MNNAKMDPADFELVLRVHLLGAAFTHAGSRLSGSPHGAPVLPPCPELPDPPAPPLAAPPAPASPTSGPSTASSASAATSGTTRPRATGRT